MFDSARSEIILYSCENIKTVLVFQWSTAWGISVESVEVDIGKKVQYWTSFFRWIQIIWTFFSEWLPFFKTRLWPRWHRNSQSLNDMDSNDTKDVGKWGRFDSTSLELLCKFCLRWSIWSDYSFWGQLCDLATPKSCYRHNLASIHATLDRNSILLKYRFFDHISLIVGVDELESGQAKFDGLETSFRKKISSGSSSLALKIHSTSVT